MTEKLQPAAPDKLLYIFIGLAVAINFSGLFIPIAGPDAAIYATISKNMVLRNDFVQLIYQGADWLDKPHLPFVVTAISFKIFGFTTWAYKLPGILVMLAGAWYTWRFAALLYNRKVALWSVLILLTAEHIVLSNNDVRAEPYLTGFIIAAVFHYFKANANNSYKQLMYGCLFAAFAVMTKGLFALIPIYGAIAGHLMITRQWKALFNVRWLVAVVSILIFILPELWSLYMQFDMHPEKVVFGRKGVSGVRFFFWDSQFGRFFNTGPITGSGDPFFFVHTLLWAFLPWSLLLYAALFQFIKKGWKNVRLKEWYCLSGALLTFLVFSASGFQLPYYLNIVFPFFAIITAQYLYYIKSRKVIAAISITQGIVICILMIAIAALYYFFRPEVFTLPAAATLFILLLMLVFYSGFMRLGGYQKIAIRTVLASFIVNLFLNLSFYPSLMQYQSGSEAAVWINQNNTRSLPVAMFLEDNPAPFIFYNDRHVATLKYDDTEPLPARPFLLYVPATEVAGLQAKGWQLRPLATFQRYWVTRLNGTFLNHATRGKVLTQMVVAEVK